MLVTIHTKKEFTAEEFGEILNSDYFMNIDLHTKIVFERDLVFLDDYIGRYKVVRTFK